MSDVFAMPPDPHFPSGNCSINAKQEDTCCWAQPNGKLFGVDIVCQTCRTGDKPTDYDCDAPVIVRSAKSGGTVAPEPPTSVAPPKVCPDGSSPDANGVCPPTTQAPTGQGTTLPPPSHNKGSNLGQLGGSLLNNNNSSRSKLTPPLTTDQGTK